MELQGNDEKLIEQLTSTILRIKVKLYAKQLFPASFLFNSEMEYPCRAFNTKNFKDVKIINCRHDQNRFPVFC